MLRVIKTVLVIWILVSLSGCLLFIPAPEIADILDQTADAGVLFSLELEQYVLDDTGRNVSFASAINEGGWEPVEGTTFEHTFTDADTYTVKITVSNGLRSDETSFTVTVE